jgi:sugar O-acyltransferase (sialic acid O-acetyltransferase NeuD family)
MNVVILGGSGHGKVVIDIVEQSGQFHVLGILDAKIPCGQQVLGYPVIGNENDLAAIIRTQHVEGLFLAVGDNWLRWKISQSLKTLAPAIQFPTAVHPSAQLARTVRLGPGTVVMAGCVVNSDTTVGDFCILNTLCSVDHDCSLGNYVSFAPHACAGGNVEVDDYTAVCLGANIIHGVKIGAHAVVGAGATVLSDLPSQVVAYGTPARAVRRRAIGEGYM